MEIYESNQNHISNKQLLKDQNKGKDKDKDRNIGEPSNNDDEQKVGVDDIVQYFKKLGQ